MNIQVNPVNGPDFNAFPRHGSQVVVANFLDSETIGGGYASATFPTTGPQPIAFGRFDSSVVVFYPDGTALTLIGANTATGGGRFEIFVGGETLVYDTNTTDDFFYTTGGPFTSGDLSALQAAGLPEVAVNSVEWVNIDIKPDCFVPGASTEPENPGGVYDASYGSTYGSAQDDVFLGFNYSSSGNFYVSALRNLNVDTYDGNDTVLLAAEETVDDVIVTTGDGVNRIVLAAGFYNNAEDGIVTPVFDDEEYAYVSGNYIYAGNDRKGSDHVEFIAIGDDKAEVDNNYVYLYDGNDSFSARAVIKDCDSDYGGYVGDNKVFAGKGDDTLDAYARGEYAYVENNGFYGGEGDDYIQLEAAGCCWEGYYRGEADVNGNNVFGGSDDDSIVVVARDAAYVEVDDNNIFGDFDPTLQRIKAGDDVIDISISSCCEEYGGGYNYSASTSFQNNYVEAGQGDDETTISLSDSFYAYFNDNLVVGDSPSRYADGKDGDDTTKVYVETCCNYYGGAIYFNSNDFYGGGGVDRTQIAIAGSRYVEFEGNVIHGDGGYGGGKGGDDDVTKLYIQGCCSEFADDGHYGGSDSIEANYNLLTGGAGDDVVSVRLADASYIYANNNTFYGGYSEGGSDSKGDDYLGLTLQGCCDSYRLSGGFYGSGATYGTYATYMEVENNEFFGGSGSDSVVVELRDFGTANVQVNRFYGGEVGDNKDGDDYLLLSADGCCFTFYGGYQTSTLDVSYNEFFGYRGDDEIRVAIDEVYQLTFNSNNLEGGEGDDTVVAYLEGCCFELSSGGFYGGGSYGGYASYMEVENNDLRGGTGSDTVILSLSEFGNAVVKDNQFGGDGRRGGDDGKEGDDLIALYAEGCCFTYYGGFVGASIYVEGNDFKGYAGDDQIIVAIEDAYDIDLRENEFSGAEDDDTISIYADGCCFYAGDVGDGLNLGHITPEIDIQDNKFYGGEGEDHIHLRASESGDTQIVGNKFYADSGLNRSENGIVDRESSDDSIQVYAFGCCISGYNEGGAYTVPSYAEIAFNRLGGNYGDNLLTLSIGPGELGNSGYAVIGSGFYGAEMGYAKGNKLYGDLAVPAIYSEGADIKGGNDTLSINVEGCGCSYGSIGSIYGGKAYDATFVGYQSLAVSNKLYGQDGDDLLSVSASNNGVVAAGAKIYDGSPGPGIGTLPNGGNQLVGGDGDDTLLVSAEYGEIAFAANNALRGGQPFFGKAYDGGKVEDGEDYLAVTVQGCGCGTYDEYGGFLGAADYRSSGFALGNKLYGGAEGDTLKVDVSGVYYGVAAGNKLYGGTGFYVYNDGEYSKPSWGIGDEDGDDTLSVSVEACCDGPYGSDSYALAYSNKLFGGDGSDEISVSASAYKAYTENNLIIGDSIGKKAYDGGDDVIDVSAEGCCDKGYNSIAVAEYNKVSGGSGDDAITISATNAGYAYVEGNTVVGGKLYNADGDDTLSILAESCGCEEYGGLGYGSAQANYNRFYGGAGDDELSVTARGGGARNDANNNSLVGDSGYGGYGGSNDGDDTLSVQVEGCCEEYSNGDANSNLLIGDGGADELSVTVRDVWDASANSNNLYGGSYGGYGGTDGDDTLTVVAESCACDASYGGPYGSSNANSNYLSGGYGGDDQLSVRAGGGFSNFANSNTLIAADYGGGNDEMSVLVEGCCEEYGSTAEANANFFYGGSGEDYGSIIARQAYNVYVQDNYLRLGLDYSDNDGDDVGVLRAAACCYYGSSAGVLSNDIYTGAGSDSITIEALDSYNSYIYDTTVYLGYDYDSSDGDDTAVLRATSCCEYGGNDTNAYIEETVLRTGAGSDNVTVEALGAYSSVVSYNDLRLGGNYSTVDGGDTAHIKAEACCDYGSTASVSENLVYGGAGSDGVTLEALNGFYSTVDSNTVSLGSNYSQEDGDDTAVLRAVGCCEYGGYEDSYAYVRDNSIATGGGADQVTIEALDAFSSYAYNNFIDLGGNYSQEDGDDSATIRAQSCCYAGSYAYVSDNTVYGGAGSDVVLLEALDAYYNGVSGNDIDTGGFYAGEGYGDYDGDDSVTLRAQGCCNEEGGITSYRAYVYDNDIVTGSGSDEVILSATDAVYAGIGENVIDVGAYYDRSDGDDVVRLEAISCECDYTESSGYDAAAEIYDNYIYTGFGADTVSLLAAGGLYNYIYANRIVMEAFYAGGTEAEEVSLIAQGCCEPETKAFVNGNYIETSNGNDEVQLFAMGAAYSEVIGNFIRTGLYREADGADTVELVAESCCGEDEWSYSYDSEAYVNDNQVYTGAGGDEVTLMARQARFASVEGNTINVAETKGYAADDEVTLSAESCVCEALEEGYYISGRAFVGGNRVYDDFGNDKATLSATGAVYTYIVENIVNVGTSYTTTSEDDEVTLLAEGCCKAYSYSGQSYIYGNSIATGGGDDVVDVTAKGAINAYLINNFVDAGGEIFDPYDGDDKVTLLAESCACEDDNPNNGRVIVDGTQVFTASGKDEVSITAKGASYLRLDDNYVRTGNDIVYDDDDKVTLVIEGCCDPYSYGGADSNFVQTGGGADEIDVEIYGVTSIYFTANSFYAGDDYSSFDEGDEVYVALTGCGCSQDDAPSYGRIYASDNLIRTGDGDDKLSLTIAATYYGVARGTIMDAGVDGGGDDELSLIIEDVDYGFAYDSTFIAGGGHNKITLDVSLCGDGCGTAKIYGFDIDADGGKDEVLVSAEGQYARINNGSGAYSYVNVGDAENVVTVQAISEKDDVYFNRALVGNVYARGGDDDDVFKVLAIAKGDNGDGDSDVNASANGNYLHAQEGEDEILISAQASSKSAGGGSYTIAAADSNTVFHHDGDATIRIEAIASPTQSARRGGEESTAGASVSYNYVDTGVASYGDVTVKNGKCTAKIEETVELHAEAFAKGDNFDYGAVALSRIEYNTVQGGDGSQLFDLYAFTRTQSVPAVGDAEITDNVLDTGRDDADSAVYLHAETRVRTLPGASEIAISLVRDNDIFTGDGDDVVDVLANAEIKRDGGTGTEYAGSFVHDNSIYTYGGDDCVCLEATNGSKLPGFQPGYITRMYNNYIEAGDGDDTVKLISRQQDAQYLLDNNTIYGGSDYDTLYLGGTGNITDAGNASGFEKLDITNKIKNQIVSLDETEVMDLTDGGGTLRIVGDSSDRFDTYNWTYAGKNGKYKVYTQGGATVETKLGTGDYNLPPIFLDLEGDGLEWTTAKDGILFDVDGDGELEQLAWAGGVDDAVLAWDADGDGIISTLEEISFASRVNTPGASDLEGLATFDSNGDGLFDANDDEFENFVLWRESEIDGQGSGDELTSLVDAGIESIDLDLVSEEPYHEAGANVLGTGEFTTTDGETGSFADATLAWTEIDLDAVEGDDPATESGELPSGDDLLDGETEPEASEEDEALIEAVEENTSDPEPEPEAAPEPEPDPVLPPPDPVEEDPVDDVVI